MGKSPAKQRDQAKAQNKKKRGASCITDNEETPRKSGRVETIKLKEVINGLQAQCQQLRANAIGKKVGDNLTREMKKKVRTLYYFVLSLTHKSTEDRPNIFLCFCIFCRVPNNCGLFHFIYRSRWVSNVVSCARWF